MSNSNSEGDNTPARLLGPIQFSPRERELFLMEQAKRDAIRKQCIDACRGGSKNMKNIENCILQCEQQYPRMYAGPITVVHNSEKKGGYRRKSRKHRKSKRRTHKRRH